VKLAGLAVGGAAAGATLAVATGAARWNRETARVLARLSERSRDHARDEAADAELDSLPPPVRRYLAYALAPGQRPIRRARVDHSGEFAMRPGRWARFTSVQHFTTDPPGFVWDARIAMAPVVGVRVRDSYLGGVGSMHGAVAGLVTVVSEEGTREMAASALWRYLAEAVWFPTALLPSRYLRWEPVDDSTARATLADGDAVAAADFHFAASGEVERVTGTRYRSVGDRQVLTPTEGRHSRYERVEGMMIPTRGEVAWLLPEGTHTYWRGRVVAARYE
jgi:hypothetical protein